MKKLVSGFVLLIPLASHPVFAMTTQNQIEDSCKRQASGMSNDQREEFLQDCVKNGAVQQRAPARKRAASCTELAQDKRGDDRKAFLRKCRDRYR
jgi:hypothetical protein